MKSFLRVWLSISLIAIGIGLGLLIIAAASGVRWKDVSTFSMNESYNNVENLDIDISYGKVKIVKGNEFSISADNVPKDEFKSYVSEGTWYMKEDGGSYFNLFGIKLPEGRVTGWNDDYNPDITITIPEGFTANNINISVGAGTAEAEEITASVGEFEVGAGEIQIRHLTVDEKSTYHVGAGEMQLRDVKAKNISVDCGVGNVEIDGDITGENTIETGIGNVDLNLDKDEEDYSYRISAVGEVNIDGDSYHTITDKTIDNNSENYLNLDCGIGKISVDFK